MEFPRRDRASLRGIFFALEILAREQRRHYGDLPTIGRRETESCEDEFQRKCTLEEKPKILLFYSIFYKASAYHTLNTQD